jgi:putative ABC transport system permease protein
MFSNYLKIAWRNLWRNRVYSFINIAGLTVGLACCMLILLYSKDEVSYDRFHAKKDRIHRVTVDMKRADGTEDKMGYTGMMPGPKFTAALPGIETFVRVQSDDYTIRRGTEVFEQESLDVDSNFLSVFSFPLLSGNPVSALNDIHSLVISEDLAVKFFGRKDVVGEVLEVKDGDKFQPFQVSGVARRSPQNSSIKVQLLMPMKYANRNGADDQWVNFFLNTFLVLKPEADPAAVKAGFKSVFLTDAASQIKEMKEKFGFKDQVTFGLQPLLGMHMDPVYTASNGLTDASNPIYAYILNGIAILILLIACINFVNLAVARSLKRAREIGIRKVVGGERGQLIRQFLGESYIIAGIAFILAIGLALLVLPFFNTLANKALSFSYLMDGKLIALYIGLFILTGLLAGFYPALVLSGFNPVDTLYGRYRFTGKNLLSKGMVVFQFALATFLIVATAVIWSQFNYLTHFDLGYDDSNIVTVNAEQMDRAKLDVFRNELLKNPSVKMVTTDQGGEWGTIAHVNGETELEFDFKIVDEKFLPLMKIPVVRGRNFASEMLSDSADGVMVNETFVKKAGWNDPIGQVVDFWYQPKKYRVVGVFRDYHFSSLAAKIRPQLFCMNPRYKYRRVYIKVDPQNLSATLKHVEKTFKALFPFKAYAYKFKDASNKEQYDQENKWKQIISFSALLAIFISCIGLFGLATLAAEKRTKEIGIRKVLGASVKGIAQLLSGDFLKLILISVVVALPVAWWAMNKWLDNYPYRIQVSPWVLIGAALVVLCIALLTVSWQAIRAGLANPVKSLRSE